MCEEDSPEDWLSAVEQELDDALASAPSHFAALLQALPSIDPLVVVGALRRRAEHGSAPAAALLASASGEGGQAPISPRPIAHPLDYDWRFTAETSAELAARLDRATGAGQTIGYLGAPAAFALAAQELPGRQHVLLDRSARWPAPPSDRARIISVDLLLDSLPTLELDAAVLDPPWYPEYLDAFLWTAASLLRTRGVALVSFPPLAMRPGVMAEREKILRNAGRAGLIVDHDEPLVLRYATPPFERAAFAAAGVRAVPGDWRRGDMLTLRKTDDRAVERPAPAGCEPEWTFVEINGIPLATRELNAASESITSPLIEPAVPGAVLPTVSRRDPARADAVLWSSRNRIYKSNAPTALRALVRSLADGGEAVGAVERALKRPLTTAEEENMVAAANELRKLIQTEREEHGLG